MAPRSAATIGAAGVHLRLLVELVVPDQIAEFPAVYLIKVVPTGSVVPAHPVAFVNDAFALLANTNCWLFLYGAGLPPKGHARSAVSSSCSGPHNGNVCALNL